MGGYLGKAESQGQIGQHIGYSLANKIKAFATRNNSSSKNPSRLEKNTKMLAQIRDKYKVGLFLFLFSLLSCGCGDKSNSGIIDLPYSTIKPKVICLDLPAQDDGMGGLITVDVNDDGQKDFIITKAGHIGVYDHSGKRLWAKQIDVQLTNQSETYGLPGLHAPGVQAADVDGDEKTEVLFLTNDNALHIVQGTSGATKRNIRIKPPEGAERWEHLVVANFRGKGDRDLLLQATNAKGCRMGRYLAAYSFDDLMRGGSVKPLWTRDDFVPNAHNGARVVDLNGDGKDEVLGGTILSPDGRILFRIPLKGHIDSIFAADVRPDTPGIGGGSLRGKGRHMGLRRRKFSFSSHQSHYQ